MPKTPTPHTTTFRLSKGHERTEVTVDGVPCTLFGDEPAEVKRLEADGWHVTMHKHEPVKP